MIKCFFFEMDCLMIHQKTLQNVATISGIGVHTGKEICLILNPAPTDTGIVFRRSDLDPLIEVAALINNVVDTTLSTTLAIRHHSVATVEHLMSALAGLGIDNLYVDVDGPELPIMDGSADPFVRLLQSVGLREQQGLKKFFYIKETIEIREKDKWVRLEPFDGFKVTFSIDYDHPVISATSKKITLDFSEISYADEIGRARTFGFLDEYEYLKKNNLARGASLENTIVLSRSKILNETGLRYANEFIRHKVLDAIGDLYLLGHGLIGAFEGYKSGHALNRALVEEVLANPRKWELISINKK